MTEAQLREELRIANNELAHMVDLHPEEVCTIARLKARIGHLECRIAMIPMPQPSHEKHVPKPGDTDRDGIVGGFGG